MHFLTGGRKNIISTLRADTLSIGFLTIIRSQNSVHSSRRARLFPVFDITLRHDYPMGTTLDRDRSRMTVNHPIRALGWWGMIQNGRRRIRRSITMLRYINSCGGYSVVRKPMRVLRGTTGWMGVKPMPGSWPLLGIDLWCSIKMARWWGWVHNRPRLWIISFVNVVGPGLREWLRMVVMRSLAMRRYRTRW